MIQPLEFYLYINNYAYNFQYNKCVFFFSRKTAGCSKENVENSLKLMCIEQSTLKMGGVSVDCYWMENCNWKSEMAFSHQSNRPWENIVRLPCFTWKWVNCFLTRLGKTIWVKWLSRWKCNCCCRPSNQFAANCPSANQESYLLIKWSVNYLYSFFRFS